MSEFWSDFLLGALPGIVISFITAGVPTYLALRKLKITAPADNAAKLSGAALDMVESYRLEVQSLKDEISGVKQEFDIKTEALERKVSVQTGRITRLSGVVRDLYNGALLLVKQIEDMGLEPVWVPPASADQLIEDIRNGD